MERVTFSERAGRAGTRFVVRVIERIHRGITIKKEWRCDSKDAVEVDRLIQKSDEYIREHS